MTYISVVNIFKDTNCNSIFCKKIVKLETSAILKMQDVHLFWDGKSKHYIFEFEPEGEVFNGFDLLSVWKLDSFMRSYCAEQFSSACNCITYKAGNEWTINF